MSKRSEMQILEFALSVLSVAGGWRPLTWTSLMKHMVYNVYTFLLNGAVFMFTTTQFMYLVFNAANADEVTETTYMMLVGMIGNFKIITISLNQQNFANMLGDLLKRPFKPIEQNETMIREKFDKMIRTNTIFYLILMALATGYTTLTSLFTDFRRQDLTFKAWFPFDYSLSVMYYFVYVHQMISFTLCSFLNVACDCFFFGLLLHISCQIEILEYRLSRIAKSQAKLGEYVTHHCRIFEFADMLNDKLVIVIGSQFIGACLVVCCLFFRLTVLTTKFVYIETMMCMACALMAIFYYCWFGNQVRLKSLELSENIYNMEWLDLDNDTKKCLLIIMIRATSSPIKFTSARIVPLDLDSFVAVLKASYSVFNLMRQA